MKIDFRTALIYLLTIVGVGLAGNFVIQQPAGTEIFRIDTNGNVNISSGFLNVTSDIIDAHSGLTVTGTVTLPANSIVDAEIDTVDESTILVDANWDIGSYKFTAETLESDVATGTAPLVIASLTRVSNLNASYAAEADNLTCNGCINLNQIATPIVSSVDGVANDGGDIDLIAGAGITITPNDGADTITFTSTSGADAYVNVTGDNMTGTLIMNASNIKLTNGGNITGSGQTSTFTVDASGNVIIVLV